MSWHTKQKAAENGGMKVVYNVTKTLVAKRSKQSVAVQRQQWGDEDTEAGEASEMGGTLH